MPGSEEILARSAGENFRVASRVLPRASRVHLLAFYGFARLVDQVGDDYPGDRLAALDWIEEALREALGSAGSPHSDASVGSLTPLHSPGLSSPAPASGPSQLIRAAATSVAELAIDPAPLFDLLSANRQDQLVHDYRTIDDLVAYCRLSANPVGRLVLAAFGMSDPDAMAWSDSICTGLQLAEHWQDVAEDVAAGRIYLPADDRRRFGVGPADLAGTPDARAGAPLRALMVFEVARARRYLDGGSPLVGVARGRVRWALAGFLAGGRAALDAIEASGYEVLAGPPRPRPRRVVLHMAALLSRSARGRST